MDKEFTPISIPTTLYKKIEELIKGTEYGSVSSYVSKILRDSLAKNDPGNYIERDRRDGQVLADQREHEADKKGDYDAFH